MDPDFRKKGKFVEKEKNFFKNINSENLLKNIWQVSINSILVAITNLIFHIVMSRTLGPEQYGELETLLTINSIILISLSAVCFIVARFVAYYRTRQQFDKMKFLANWAFIFFLLIGMAGFIITIMISRIAASFLNIEDSAILMIFGFMVWISFLMLIIEGILRGLQEFSYIGKYKLLDAMMRLIIGSIMLYLGFRIKSIITGLVVSGVITLLFTTYILKRIYINRPYKIEMKEIYEFALPVFLACISFASLSNIDLVLVRHFFDPKTTGYYAAAAMLAKILLGIAFGSAGVMFPKIVEDYSNGNMKKSIKTLKNTLKIMLFVGIIITLLLAFYPHEISRAFFGVKYDIGNMLSIFVFATFFLSIVSILMMYDLAVKKYAFIMVFIVAAFIEIYQLVHLHLTVFNIVWTLLVINAILLIYMIIYNRRVLFLKYE